MSTSSLSTPTPMPGARPGVTRLPFEDVAAAGFPTLKASDAINFTDVDAQQLPGGTRLFRVYGGPAGEIGGYWSPAPPAVGETEAEWRAATAVELSWNQGTEVSVLTVPSAGMKAWAGGIAPQPAQDTSCRYLPGFLLPGGGKQLKIVDKITSAMVAKVGATPWGGPSTVCPLTAAPAPPSPPASLAAHHAHAASVQRLAGKVAGLAPAGAGHLPALAARLTQAHHDIHGALGAGADDPAAIARLQHTVLAHVGLRRHVYVDPNLSGAAEFEELLDEVVRQAVELSGLLTRPAAG